MSEEDYKVTTRWSSGRLGVSWTSDAESAELLEEFYRAQGAESVIITPPEDVL